MYAHCVVQALLLNVNDPESRGVAFALSVRCENTLCGNVKGPLSWFHLHFVISTGSRQH